MDNILAILEEVGALIQNSHLVYTSGKHGSVYVNKDAIYPHTALASQVGLLFAEMNKDLDIDVVVAPAVGGIILSQWTAHHLSQIMGREILGIYSEKTEDNNQVLKRGYDKLVAGKNILILEDITNTGGSVIKLVNEVRRVGGNVVRVCVMVNRDPVNVKAELIGAPFSSLGTVPAEAFEEADCPLCKANVPVNTSVGHGRKYVDSRQSTVDS